MLPDTVETSSASATSPSPRKAWYAVSLSDVLTLLASVVVMVLIVQVALDLRWPQRFLGIGNGTNNQENRPVSSYLQSDEDEGVEAEPNEDISPTPDPGPGQYACDSTGSCNLFDDPTARGCPRTFAHHACLGLCSDQAIQCPTNL